MSAALHVARWQPSRAAGAARAGVALLVHGAESHAGWFQDLGSGLAAAGLEALAYDRAGWGQSPGPRGHVESSELVLGELEREARALGAPVHLVGLSWGGLLAAAAATRTPDLFQSVTLIVPAIFRRRSPRTFEMLRAAVGLGTVKLPIEPKDFTRKPERLAFVEKDPWRVQRVNFGFLKATIELGRLAQGLTSPGRNVRVLLAETDALIDNRKTREWAESRGIAVRVLQNTAHSLVLEDPAGCQREILDVAFKGPGDARGH